MSPISLAMNLLLAGLLVLTLMYGWRLSRQLKALKDSHAGFADAVGDLDRAAQRAETGLVELRATTDEAVDLLIGRIDKARELADRLEKLTQRAEGAAERVSAAAPRATAAAPVRSIFERPRNGGTTAPAAAPTLKRVTEDEAVAAAEALILRLSESEMLTEDPRPSARPAARAGARDTAPARERSRGESRFDSLFEPRASRREPLEAAPEPRRAFRDEAEDPRAELRPAARAAPRPNPRSRAQIDDDLFDPPARGGRLRAFDGGLS